MQRKIKFKAWHSEQKRMFDVHGLGPDWLTEETNDGVDPGVNVFDVNNGLEYITIMQFTGLNDKNGIEIYEDSVFCDVLGSALVGVVKFGEYKHCFDKDQISFGGHFGFYVDFGKKHIRKDVAYWAKNSEVIGNIHQHPELLKP